MAVQNTTQKKRSKYSQIDKTFFGGLLPGGDPLRQSGATPEPSQISQPLPQPQQASEPVTQSKTAEGNVSRTKSGMAFPYVVNGKEYNSKSDYIQAGGQVDVLRAGQGRMGQQETLLAQEQAMQNQALAAQVGQTQDLGVNQGSGIDLGQVATQAGVRGVIGGVAGAGTLAGIGAAVGLGAAGGSVVPGAGTIIGAVAGLAAGVISAIVSNVKSQRSGNIAAQRKVLSDGQTNLNKLIKLAKVTQEPEQRAQIVQAFNYQLSQIKVAQLEMQMQTRKDVLKFEDATPDLQAYEDFYTTGGAKDYYVSAMQLALAGNIDANELNNFLMENSPTNGN